MITSPLLDDFPVIIEQPVAWAEMDPFNHVNNVVYFRYFENARVEYLSQMGWWEYLAQTKIGPIVASTSARFRKPIHYPDSLLVGARCVKLDADRFTLEHRIASKKLQDVVTLGEAVVVSIHYGTGQKVPLPELLIERIRKLENGKV